MRIYAALYTTAGRPNQPQFLGAWSAEMVEDSPSGWRQVLAQEAATVDITAIASVILEVPDADALAVLATAPTVLGAVVIRESNTGPAGS
jgi:hypothetical protein